MKNRYFLDMQLKGIKHRKKKEKQLIRINNSLQLRDDGSVALASEIGIQEDNLFSKGESYAFMVWSISDTYDASDIIVEDLPEKEDVPVFVATLKAAGIASVVLCKNALKRQAELQLANCIIGDTCYANRLCELNASKREIIKGVRCIL